MACELSSLHCVTSAVWGVLDSSSTVSWRAGMLDRLQAAEEERGIEPEEDIQQLMHLMAGAQHPQADATLFLKARHSCCFSW